MFGRYNANSVSNTTVFNNTDCFNTSSLAVRNTFTVADERSEILAWLSPLEPRMRHRAVRENRVSNVGDWLLRTEVFRSWSNVSRQDKSDNAVLFCYGNPGVGKTHITSLVIDTLGGQASEENVAVACFYFDFVARKEQSPTNVLGALLRQVVSGLGEVPEEIVKLYIRRRELIGSGRLRLPDLVKMLQTVSSSQCTFLCVDALDECTERCRLDVLNSLQAILKGSPSTRLFLTGRPRIRDAVKRWFGERVTTACISPSGGDIAEYLRARLYGDTTPEAMDSSLKRDILKIIPETISEMFSLVSLSIGAILQEPTIYRRRQKLKAMTDGLGLGDAYGATVERIKAQGGVKARLGMDALMWISHSERPLKVDELCHALGVEIGSEDLDPQNVPAIETLLHCCQGLLTLDKEASTVRLVHSTLQEYLSTCPDLFDRAHSTIAETCLTYLNSQRFKSLPTNDLSDPVQTPFLEYSSMHWGTHARRELSDCAKELALKLFDNYGGHKSAKLLLKHLLGRDRFDDSKNFSSFTGLHCASFFGIVEVVAVLVEMDGCDINQKDCVGNTPLIWAAENGQEGVVALLLERVDIKPDGPDEYGRTPLSRAAGNGREGAANLLLRQGGVNPNKPDYRGQTPLSWAAENGHEGVVKLLLGSGDVNPDKPNDRGQTPLSWAAENGHEGVVDLLLRRGDVSPDRRGFDGRAPLSWAAGNGCEGVVKLLLGRDDVRPDRPDYEGLAPLSWAVKNGQEGVVRLLLERSDVNPDRADTIFGQTPLSSAVENGHEGVVRLLLERSDVSPDRPDEILGHTPLLWAAGNGYEGVVRLLLERSDVDPGRQGFDGRTPLSEAAWNGYEGVVKLLLERNDVDPDQPDIEGQTPLSGAARNGHKGIVKLLLERNDVNPDQQDIEGQTPLSGAACNGHEGIVKLLLERSDVDPNQLAHDGRTPLTGAAREGHERVVNLLLKRKDVTPDKPDRPNHTPPPPRSTSRKRLRLVVR